MSISAKNLWRFLCAAAAITLMAAALTFAVDPLQLFRPARLFPAMYSADSRMQNAGLIRSQDFDTVFMGTSLAIHFRQSEIDKALGTRSLKLAMTGSNSREQGFVLQHKTLLAGIRTGHRELERSSAQGLVDFALAEVNRKRGAHEDGIEILAADQAGILHATVGRIHRRKQPRGPEQLQRIDGEVQRCRHQDEGRRRA